jgi:HEAT repeat protein
VGDRFRLIYLKSTDLERSKADEPPSFYASEEIPGDDSPFTESMTAGTFSTQAILKQARADLEHPDPKARILAIRYLGDSDPSITLPLLQEILFDKDPEVRIEALSCLIKIKNSNILPQLKKSLRDKDPRVRLLAVRGMFRMGEKIDLNILLQFLSDESPWVRRRLATLLGWGQHEGVLPIVMELCKDRDAGVRKAALFSLTTLYPEECENRLVEAMTDSDPDIRKWARGTLEKIAATPRKENRASLSREG